MDRRCLQKQKGPEQTIDKPGSATQEHKQRQEMA